MAGVRVGKVKTVDLQGDHVRVEFLVDSGVDFGTRTGAAIKVKTLLGAMYLALEPQGAASSQKGSEIPVHRTTSPYDVVQAFCGLADRSERIDTDQLAKALNTIGALTENTPEEFQARAARDVRPVAEHRRARRAAQHAARATCARSPGSSVTAAATWSR